MCKLCVGFVWANPAWVRIKTEKVVLGKSMIYSKNTGISLLKRKLIEQTKAQKTIEKRLLNR